MRVGADPDVRPLAWLRGMHVVNGQPGGKADTALAPSTSVPGDPLPGSGSSAPPCWG